MQYNDGITLNYNGPSGMNKRGELGKNIRVEVKVVTHTETNAPLLQYNIYEVAGNKLKHSIRLPADQPLKVRALGGNGAKGQKSRDNGHGYDGGNGGDIELIVDPSVKKYTFVPENHGGQGGRALYSTSNDGRDGREGRFTKIERKVSF